MCSTRMSASTRREAIWRRPDRHAGGLRPGGERKRHASAARQDAGDAGRPGSLACPSPLLARKGPGGCVTVDETSRIRGPSCKYVRRQIWQHRPYFLQVPAAQSADGSYLSWSRRGIGSLVRLAWRIRRRNWKSSVRHHAGVIALERMTLHSPPLEGVVLRYGQFYGPGTWNTAQNGRLAVHIDAAAHAVLLAVEANHTGIFNIAEENGLVSIEKARRELGWSPGFRLHEKEAAA